MTRQELDQFLDENAATIEWKADGAAIYLRDTGLPAYQQDGGLATRVLWSTLPGLTPDTLRAEIRRGYDVEGITRITGYYGKTRQFNPGKSQEMRDRVRFDGVEGQDRESYTDTQDRSSYVPAERSVLEDDGHTD